MRRIILFLMLGGFAFLLSSCNKEIQNEAEEQTSYTVSFNFSGDISVSDEPLTKGTPTNNLYGINVYYDGTEANVITDKYAYGLFDNVGDMTITLLSGHKYKFECTLVINGKTLLESSNIGKYEAPFGQILENQFVLGTDTVMDGIKRGTSRMKGESSDIETPRLDRYYGETTNYVPTVGGTVVIDLIRTSFGVKFVVTGLANDGTLTVASRNNTIQNWTQPYAEGRSYSYYSFQTTENTETGPYIFTIPAVYECWQNYTSYSFIGAVKLNYDSDRGQGWDTSQTEEITWKRNVLTTVNVVMNPDLSGGALQINEETLGEDNVIDISINGDGFIETPVEPNV